MHGDVSGKSARGVTELLAGGLAGQMALACLAVCDASMCARMCACLLCRLEAWLVAAVRTDSVPMLWARFTTFPNTPDSLKEREEHEIERGRERERERERKRESQNLLCWLAVGWMASSRLAGRLVVSLAG